MQEFLGGKDAERRLEEQEILPRLETLSRYIFEL